MTSLATFFHRNRLVLVTLVFTLCFFSLSFGSVTFADHSPDHVISEQNQGWVARALDGVGDIVAGIVYSLSLAIGGMFTGIGGLLLDVVVDQTILKAGLWFSPGTGSGLGEAIYSMWAMVRDILNILFIFAFIFIGIKTILDANSSETQRSLGFLILAALLVNFSLFFTQVIIDFSNIAAIQIHNLITSGLSAGSDVGSSVFGEGSIAGGFINVASLTSFFWFESSQLEGMGFHKQLIYSLMMMVFLIIAGIVFGLAAILLIRRFIVLILCMIFSPIMFAGWIFPKLSGQQEEWRGKLLMNAFFAPAFFFMVYLSLVVLQRIKDGIFGDTQPGFSVLTDGAAMDVTGFTIVLFFCLAIGFLWASIKVGEMMSIAGAKGALKITQKAIGGIAGGMTVGLGARIGRNVVGRGAYALAESDKFKDLASRNVLFRGAWKATKGVGDSNMDARAAGFGDGMMGEARKGGYKTTTEEAKKREQALLKDLGEVSDDDKKVKAFTDTKEQMEEELELLKLSKEGATGEGKEAIQAQINAKQAEIKEQDKIIRAEKNRRAYGAYIDPRLESGTAQRYSETTEKREEAETHFAKASRASIDAKKAIAKTGGEIAAAEKEIAEAEKEIAEAKTEEAKQLAVAKKETASIKKASSQSTREAAKTAQETAVNNLKVAYKGIKEQNKIIKDLKKEAKKNTGNTGYVGTLENSWAIQHWVLGRVAGQDRYVGKKMRKDFDKGDAKKEAKEHVSAHKDEEHVADKPADNASKASTKPH